tara:strand:- start:44 stop:283 length:240 start_codon:yes stop_codon:yes gene_type:complete
MAKEIEADPADVGFIFGEIDHLEETVKVLSKRTFHEDRRLNDQIEALWDAVHIIRKAIPSIAEKLDVFGRYNPDLRVDK